MWRNLIRFNRTWIAVGLILCISVVLSLPHYLKAKEAARINPAKYGWKISAPEHQGLDSILLEDAAEALGETDATSLVVIRHGMVVFERYYRSQCPGDFSFSASAANLVLSALVGLSLEAGELQSDQQPAMEFYKEYEDKIRDERVRKIRLGHLLTMNAGFGLFPEELFRSTDWVGSQLALPLRSEPGKAYYHSPESMYLLSGILSRVTGKSALELAKARLFKPLSIPFAIWHTGPEKYNIAGDFFYMKPLDLAKLGWLYVNHGEWEGVRVLPREWADVTLGRQLEARAGRAQGVGISGREPGLESVSQGYMGYGFGVAERLVEGFHVYTAEGKGTPPNLCMIPDLDMILVITSYPAIFKRDYKYEDMEQVLKKMIHSLTGKSPARNSLESDRGGRDVAK